MLGLISGKHPAGICFRAAFGMMLRSAVSPECTLVGVLIRASLVSIYSEVCPVCFGEIGVVFPLGLTFDD